MRSIYLFSLGLVVAASLSASAQAKKSKPAPSGAPHVTEATVQRTIYGRRETSPRIDYRFVIVWKSKASPEVFFWRPDANTWSDVTIAKPERRPGLGSNDFMIVERHTKYAEIHNGDQIIITPHNHSDEDHEMPASVKKMPVSSLYYKVGNKWMSVPIKPVKRPDIALP